MKLIQQSKLFFKEGKSDKVYEIDLCELSASEFLVNFRYGRRGSVLKEGTKTPAAISKEKADLLFAELENEKRKKGYQTETEVFMELPSLDAVDPGSVNGAILQRLQDAIVGRNSFKTEWKTSRVIWKAGILNVTEAIPFIIKLGTRGDDMQTYSALWALNKLEATTAKPLFVTLANNIKQKNHIVTLAWEGLLTISGADEQPALLVQLLEKLPAEVRYAIETDDLNLLKTVLMQYTADKEVDFATTLYLLAKIKPQLLPVLVEILKTWQFRPPYFKHIRAIYKLAQLRNDVSVLAVLFYQFEKQEAMFKRTTALDSGQRQHLAVINQMVRVGAELKSKDSKLAFSQFTKAYFQKNAVEFIKNAGASANAGTYLKLAVNTLLQYREKDYSAAEEKPFNTYGKYDYKTKRYSYLLLKYPECSASLLLSTILFGNDPSRKLQPNLKFITGSRMVISSSYYYSENQSQAPQYPAGSVSIIDTAKNIFKSLFGKKSVDLPHEAPKAVASAIEKPEPVVEEPRFELYPAYWDTMPEAYVQLLMQAQMNRIHLFAYERLKLHPRFEEIVNRFDQRAVLQLLDSDFELPGRFGFETLRTRESEWAGQIGFVARVLDCNNGDARQWAQKKVDENIGLYFNDIEFILPIIFNSHPESNTWINESLQNHAFAEERVQAILGKTIAEMLQFENTDINNNKAKTAISRLMVIAGAYMEKISWEVVEQLISSALNANKILAGKILLIRSKNTEPTAIPFSLTELFLIDELPEVRQNGIALLNQYPDAFVVKNIKLLLHLIDSDFDEVSLAILVLLQKLIASYPEEGNTIIPYFAYALMRKEKFEGAHARISQFLLQELKPYWNSGLQPKDITKLMHAQYRISHLAAYEILRARHGTENFSLKQIISFGSHEILAVRQWSWNYFNQNVDRIRKEKNQSLYLLDAKWDDTRAFAFHYFKTKFTVTDWDPDTLIGIVDSIKPDVESFGKEMITLYFNAEHAVDYLTRLSEHPSINVQAFVSNYLSLYAKDNPGLLKELTFYFRSALTRVNKGRVAKNRIFSFLHHESLKNVETAIWAVSILDDVSAQSTVQDKASCIDILTGIKKHYPELDMQLMIKN
ncbi:WGR domain-containing protein [Pedobacter miscanthi]|uniref:WGR domain-containing protein n=1 Tax=Pedobacter miscanthi TaxID=2259170 RepID=UPI00292E7680|nr:WGR domain-containing protein [Pedobacter miscanthi]